MLSVCPQRARWAQCAVCRSQQHGTSCAGSDKASCSLLSASLNALGCPCMSKNSPLAVAGMVMGWSPEAPFTTVLCSNMSWAVSAERAERCSRAERQQRGRMQRPMAGRALCQHTGLSMHRAQQSLQAATAKGCSGPWGCG